MCVWVVVVCVWLGWCGCALVCEGVLVFLCVFVLVCFGCVSLFALFAVCACCLFWVCSSVSVFVVFSCAVSCVLMDFRLPS